KLLATHPAKWKQILELDDDPVPTDLVRAIDELEKRHLDALARALSKMPQNESAKIKENLKHARDTLNKVFRDCWQHWLAAACSRGSMPLLILDQAHHLKNPGTRLASLFRASEAEEEATMLGGPLSGVFERMLFLTATPFQLGHHELLRVLERFENVGWAAS